MAEITSAQVWEAIDKELFAVVGMVTASNEARTAGIVYTVSDHRLYFSTARDAWKTRHIERNDAVSITIPIAKRVPLMPWIKVPAAVITFQGVATVLEMHQVSDEINEPLHRGLKEDLDEISPHVVVEIEPVGDFVTYGIGVSLLQMRDPELARGRAAVA